MLNAISWTLESFMTHFKDDFKYIFICNLKLHFITYYIQNIL